MNYCEYGPRLTLITNTTQNINIIKIDTQQNETDNFLKISHLL